MIVVSMVVRLSGTMTTRVCHHTDLETSSGVSHCCEVKLRKYPVHPPRPEPAVDKVNLLLPLSTRT